MASTIPVVLGGFIIIGIIGFILYWVLIHDTASNGGDQLPPSSSCTVFNTTACDTADDLSNAIILYCQMGDQNADACDDACHEWYMQVSPETTYDPCTFFSQTESGKTGDVCYERTYWCSDCDPEYDITHCTPLRLWQLVTDEAYCSTGANARICANACDQLWEQRVLDRCSGEYNYCVAQIAGDHCQFSTVNDFEQALDTCEDYTCTRICRLYGTHIHLAGQRIDECLNSDVCNDVSASCCTEINCESEALYWLHAEQCT